MSRRTNNFATAVPAHGVTLLELMVTLAIVAVVLGLGMPSFRGMLTKYRADASSSALLAAFQLAREEAKNSTAVVTVCASTNGVSCTNSAWNKGHIVFRDGATLGAVDAGDAILRIDPAADAAVTVAAAIQSTGAAFSAGYVSFDGDGKLVGPNALTFTSCVTGKTPLVVVVRRNGHISPSKGTTTC